MTKIYRQLDALEQMRSFKAYSKAQLSGEQQIEDLKKMGLRFTNDDRADHWLQTVGYFHLKAYLSCFKNPEDRNQFLPYARFSDATNILEWERRLRSVLLEQIGKVELRLRAAIVEAVGTGGGDSYLSEEIFDVRAMNNEDEKRSQSNNPLTRWQWFEGLLDLKIRDFKKGSKLPYETRFLDKHRNQRIPIWMLIETFTFDEVVQFYRALNKEGKNSVARSMANPDVADGKIRPVELEKLLIALREWRNSAAHFHAFFDKSFSFKFSSEFRENFIDCGYFPNLQSKSECKSYGIVLILMFLSPSFQRESSWVDEVADILHKFPKMKVAVDVGIVGAPKNWHLNWPWTEEADPGSENIYPEKKRHGIQGSKREISKKNKKIY
jgi:abortive infection bacteriophage resistance protein